MAKENDLTYFIMGLGLGVAVGMLFAPRSGGETREIIQAKAKVGTDYLKTKAVDAASVASQAVERGGKAARLQKENVVAAVEAGKVAYQEAAASTPSL